MLADDLGTFFKAYEEFRTKYPHFETTLAETLPFQRAFTERLLVSLIWGRPESRKKDNADEKRLAKAYKGLLGNNSSFSSQSRYRYDLLLEIEQEYHAQRWAVEQGTRIEVDTFEKLAETFAKRKSEVSQLRRDAKNFIEARWDMDANMLLEFETLQKLALEAVEIIVTKFGVRFHHYE